MDLELWIAFALASLLLALIPGPGVVSIVGFAVSSGRRTALASVAGMAAGNFTAMSLSLAGLGAILAASATAFTVLKFAGAAYLIVLGVLTFARARKATAAAIEAPPSIRPRTAFWTNVAVGTFHPKTIAFFVAFAPQFLAPERPYLPQAAIMILTFTGIAAITDSLYALAASGQARRLRSVRTRRIAARAGGSVLIAAGVATALARR